jgi:hypothetical protein
LASATTSLKNYDQWYGPDATFFKVRADDGNQYILRKAADDEWTLEAFREVKK